MDVNSSAVLPPTTGIICLIDDDLSMLKALDRLLSSAGLQAQLFSEPLAFLSYVTGNSVALAVIDIWMSGMSGLQVQKKLQIVLPKARVIIITATDEESVRNAAIQGGAIAYFVKPFDDDAFLAAVHEKLLEEIVWPHFWAIQIILFVLIVTYCTMHELVRVIGRKKVLRIFFGPMPIPQV